jgi:transposase
LPELLGSLYKAGSMKMAKATITTAGIDTAKSKLDIAIHKQSRRWQVQNDLEGWQALADALTKAGVDRVGIEATGAYERGVVTHLRKTGFTVLVLQPAQVKAYARFRLRRAKNDAIDAALIASCAANLDKPLVEPDERLTQLADLLTFIEQIEEDITRWKVRLEHIGEQRLRQTVAEDIARLKARRTAELANIAAALHSDADLGRRLDLVLSVQGIGERTAIAIVVRMPEIGQVSREEISALAGLAPFDNDSGKHKGKRHIAGGRDRVRRSLYAAALAAAFRWNPAIKELYQRLTARGKPHKLALVACARKLLIFANTVVQRQKPWSDKKQTA